VKQAVYVIVFYSIRNRQSLKILSRQIFGSDILCEALNDISKSTKFPHVMLDLRPNCPERLRIRHGWVGLDKDVYFYSS
jgi:hypothetical protein